MDVFPSKLAVSLLCQSKELSIKALLLYGARIKYEIHIEAYRCHHITRCVLKSTLTSPNTPMVKCVRSVPFPAVSMCEAS